MAVLTISRQFGAGGRTLGEAIATRLEYRYVEEDLIKELAIKAKVSARQIKEFEERGISKLLKFLDKIVSASYVDRLSSDDYRYVDEEIYMGAIKTVIEDLYHDGNVVIIGRGGQYILKGCENVRRILLIGSLEHRVRFMMERYSLSEARAAKAIRRADQIRTRFLNLFASEGAHDDPLTYDLTINMEQLSMEEAEGVVVGLIRP
jgi:cytidylate kinase